MHNTRQNACACVYQRNLGNSLFDRDFPGHFDGKSCEIRDTRRRAEFDQTMLPSLIRSSLGGDFRCVELVFQTASYSQWEYVQVDTLYYKISTRILYTVEIRSSYKQAKVFKPGTLKNKVSDW